MVSILPVGFLPNDPKHKTALFWSLPRDGFDDWRNAPFKDWQEQAATLWPSFASYAELLINHGDLTMAKYIHGTLRNPTRDRLAQDTTASIAPETSWPSPCSHHAKPPLPHAAIHRSVSAATASPTAIQNNRPIPIPRDAAANRKPCSSAGACASATTTGASAGVVTGSLASNSITTGF
ncbi:MAG: hypothetical protein QNK92_02780 [Amylibacter sp.]